MSREADMMTVAEAIAEILIKEGFVDFGGGSADSQLTKILRDLHGPIAEFIEAQIVQEEADANPADGSEPLAYDGSVEGLMKFLP